MFLLLTTCRTGETIISGWLTRSFRGRFRLLLFHMAGWSRTLQAWIGHVTGATCSSLITLRTVCVALLCNTIRLGLHSHWLYWALWSICRKAALWIRRSRITILDSSGLDLLLISIVRLVDELWLQPIAPMVVKTRWSLLLVVLPSQCCVFLRRYRLYMTVLLRASHFLWLLDLLSTNLWQDLLWTILVLLRAHSIKTVRTSHWNSLDSLFTARTRSSIVTWCSLVHLIVTIEVHLWDSFAIHLRLELLWYTYTLLGRMDWRSSVHLLVDSNAIISSVFIVSNLGSDTTLIKSTRGQTSLSALKTVNSDSLATV